MVEKFAVKKDLLDPVIIFVTGFDPFGGGKSTAPYTLPLPHQTVL